MIYYASQFDSRQDLDFCLQHRVKEADDVIIGDHEELGKLSLSNMSVVFGVPVKYRE